MDTVNVTFGISLSVVLQQKIKAQMALPMLVYAANLTKRSYEMAVEEIESAAQVVGIPTTAHRSFRLVSDPGSMNGCVR